MRTAVLPLVLVVAGSACQGETSVAPPPEASVFIAVTQPGEGQRPPAGFEGTWIDIVPGVEYRYTLITGVGIREQGETRINGHKLTIESAFIVIGPKSFGPLPKGTHVEISNAGVSANGKLLGPLPERMPMPPDDGDG